ncbi:ribose-5-phosphate isomerase RpiA [Lichenihabitans psoromatis]|uniref:ribose-5-phosphate isomerase RpiA n=1 Tax=Lichenihabitans psoromatis TaxID=2528642 RepID=UPI001035919F|nr:ribose-5-phosphate isomerase RpiA [Lichenihabitans psoromatis]
MAESDPDTMKRQVAERALSFVDDGMKLGLGSGTTAKIFVDLLAERVKSGLRVRCVPTSERIRAQATSLGLDVTTLDELPQLDLTIDGADEYDPALRLIKGGGGALLREKIVATASDRMIVIADASKAVSHLGRFPLPVEVNLFGFAATRRLIERDCAAIGLHGNLVLRTGPDKTPFMTDGGHLILDCHFGSIADPVALSDVLLAIAGVVEHGLFIGIAQSVITNVDGAACVVAPDHTSSSSR